MSLRGKIKQKIHKVKAKLGMVPRGRVLPKQSYAAYGGGLVVAHTYLLARHLRNGVEIDRREVHDRVVTTAFVNDIVDNLIAETSAFGDYKYHDSGTGTGDEAIGDTSLGTPCGEARDTGTQVEGAANVYTSVATHTYAGAFAITEHGLFNASTSGTLMDRTKFAAINVSATDQIEFSFTITFTAGG